MKGEYAQAMSTSSTLGLLGALAAMGCVPDTWVTLPAQDAGSRDVSAEAGPPDVPTDAGFRDMACLGAAVSLYHGEDDTDDGAGDRHAVRSRVGYAPGRVGRAFSFGGNREPQYVELPADVGDFGVGDFTLGLWFSSSYSAGNQTILARRSACWNRPVFTGQDIRLAYNGRLFVELWSSAGSFTLASEPGLNDGRWHHLAIVRAGTTARLFVDAVPVATTPLPGSVGDTTETPTYLGVGRCVQNAPGSNGTHDDTHWFTGRIDEVGFFARALSEPELAALTRGDCVP